MTVATSHVLRRLPIYIIGSTKRISTTNEKVSRNVDMQWVSRLRMTIAFDLNGMMQKRHAIAFFVDIDPFVQKAPKSGQVAHLDRNMRRSHVFNHNNILSTTRNI